jgi:hypothetical protein
VSGAREEQVDALANDARALLRALDGHEPSPLLARAARLLAAVTGQDLGEDAAGSIPDRPTGGGGPGYLLSRGQHGLKTVARHRRPPLRRL